MNKMVLIIVGVVVVIGTVIGLGFAGIINIPGVTKKASIKTEKKDDKAATPAPAATKTTSDDAKSKEEAEKAAKLVAEEKAAADKRAADELGYKKLAGVWGEMAPDAVGALIVAHYKPDQVAPILKLMDEDQVAAIFTAMAAAQKAAGTTSTAKTVDIASYGDALAKEVGKTAPPDATKS